MELSHAERETPRGKKSQSTDPYLHKCMYTWQREISVSMYMCSVHLLPYSMKIPAAGAANALGRAGKTRIIVLSQCCT